MGFEEGQGRMSVLFAQVSCIVHKERLKELEARSPGQRQGTCLVSSWVPAHNEATHKKPGISVNERICVGRTSTLEVGSRRS